MICRRWWQTDIVWGWGTETGDEITDEAVMVITDMGRAIHRLVRAIIALVTAASATATLVTAALAIAIEIEILVQV